MKAAFIRKHGGLEVLEIGEVPTPEPASGEVRVRVTHSALNHLDIWVREGFPGLSLSFPHVLGGDAYGIVDALGGKAKRFRVGDKVIVHPGISCGKCKRCRDEWESLCPDYKILGENVNGSNAQYVCVPERNLFRKPKKLSDAEAASIPLVFTTAWQMLVRLAKVKKGELVLLHGVGSGVTQAGIQIAKLFKTEIVVTSSNPEKLKIAQGLGAHHVIDSSKEDFAKAIRKIRKEGPDVIFDHVGKVFWERNIKCVRSGGRIVVCGATSGKDGLTDLNHVFFRQIQIHGSTMGEKSDFGKMLKHFESGALKAVVDKVFPLAQVKAAQMRMADRGQNGKIIIGLPT